MLDSLNGSLGWFESTPGAKIINKQIEIMYKLFRVRCYSHPEYLFAEGNTLNEVFDTYLTKVKRYGNRDFAQWAERVTKEFMADPPSFFVTGRGSMFYRLA